MQAEKGSRLKGSLTIEAAVLAGIYFWIILGIIHISIRQFQEMQVVAQLPKDLDRLCEKEIFEDLHKLKKGKEILE